MTSLTKVWSEVKIMLNDGFSLIPVRDKDEGDFTAKMPYAKWKEFQSRRMNESELWQMMSDKGTEAVALICGKISGNLELIDIDSKYYEGISIKLFKEIKSLRPDLYDKLRVHKTPSGGYHILYRIADGEPEGNQKLAERPKTEEELHQDIKNGQKRPKKYVAFLETRGEGGFALMPPSLHYSIHINNPIPLISWLDRCELIQICKSFNENIPKQVTYTRKKSDDTAYDLTPWEDYNENSDVISLLSEYGWQLHPHQNAERYYFIRPGKNKGISASLTRKTNKFYPFTVSTELEAEKTYSPCDLLVIYKFNGDKSAAFKYMVENGYGKVKKSIEKRIAKQRAYSGGQIPNNFSEQAKTAFEQLKSDLVENMPFGVFWQEDPKNDGKFIISREDLYNISDQLGFKLYGDDMLVRINGKVITQQNESDYYDVIKKYIWEEESEIYTSICNSIESFFQKSGKYTISRLRRIPIEDIAKDTKTNAYKFFQNGYVEITANGYEFKEYDTLQGLIWEHKVKNRNWTGEKGSNLYATFLENAIGITDYLKRAIGYLSHDFKEESAGYIIVMTETVPNPKDGGGSGKNLFGNLLSNTTTVCTVPGSLVKFDDRFMNAWNYERIYFLPDLPKRIDWLFLKEISNGKGYINKKYKGEFTVEAPDMPKLLMNTNYSFEDADGGLIRRIRQIEFKPFYTEKGGVDVVHGKMFPNDFTEHDWAGFDTFIAECLTEILKTNGKLERVEMTESGWRKKFQMTYKEITLQFIEDNISTWINNGFISNTDFKNLYTNFTDEYDVPQKFRLSSQYMNEALEEYCKKHEINYDKNSRIKVNSILVRGKTFGDNTTELDDIEPF